MHVLVQHDSAVASGVATIDPQYVEGRLVIVIRFNPADIEEHFLPKFSSLLEGRAKALVPRCKAPEEAWRPIKVSVERVDDLPGSVGLIIEADGSHSDYRFCASVITPAGAIGFEDMMRRASLSFTWVGTRPRPGRIAS